MQTLQGKSVLLVISGGIAAYKALELIRQLRKDGAMVRCVLTAGGAQFITALSVAALTEQPCYTDLWSLKDETEMGHIRLSREADIIVVAPASANMIAKLANGITDDLASTALLAANKPIMIAPAMNHMMWLNPATQDNIAKLRARGITVIGPDEGDMACGEYGPGRMSEPAVIADAIANFLSAGKPLSGLSALVTSGPTYEPLDPVRFIGNRSSGKQGHAIATVLAAAGASVTLISGPVMIPDPAGVRTIHVETATEMLRAALENLPADIAVCAAAVSDWSAATVHRQKIKKDGNSSPPDIKLKENPDILAAIARDARKRPHLVVGFAAETENLLNAAKAKRNAKGCDWIVANDVAADKVFGADENHVYLLTGDETQEWPKADKHTVARKLVARIATHFTDNNNHQPAAAE